MSFTEKKEKNQMIGEKFLFYRMEGVISLIKGKNTIMRRVRKVR